MYENFFLVPATLVLFSVFHFFLSCACSFFSCFSLPAVLLLSLDSTAMRGYELSPATVYRSPPSHRLDQGGSR